MIRSSVVAVVLAVASAARADERDVDESISLDQLVELAVRRSPELARIRTDVKRAKLAPTIAKAPAQLRVDASAGGAQNPALRTVDARLGVAKQLPTGAEVAASVERRRELATGALPLAAGVDPERDLTALSASFRQPLLRGIGSHARTDERKARVLADAATLEARDANALTLRDLEASYWELAFARASLGVRKQSLALAESQLELTKKLHARGALPDAAIASARYGVALRQEARLRAEDAVQSASLRLRRLAGLEISIELGDLAPTDTLEVPKRAVELDAAIASALAGNPRIAAARLGIRVAELERGRRKNLALPGLDLVAGGTTSPDGRDYELAARVELRWEIGGAASAAAESARVDRSAARLTAKDVERETIAFVIETVRRLRAARARVDVARVAIDLAKANLDTELALFRADKSSNVLVFERQTELDEARLLASRAAADCLIARATLDYLTGSLLDRHGIQLDPTPTPKGARNAPP
jgi:outer membrane protein TolC